MSDDNDYQRPTVLGTIAGVLVIYLLLFVLEWVGNLMFNMTAAIVATIGLLGIMFYVVIKEVTR